MNQAPFQRRKNRLFVEKDFQYRFTLRICLLAGLIFAVFSGFVLFFVRLSYEMLIQGALLQMPDMVAKLKWEFRAMSTGIIVSFLLFMTVLFTAGILLTRRIAGPLLSIKKRLQDFALGHEGVRVRLRSGDEFHNLEDVFNFAMEAHERRVGGLKERARRALHMLSSDRKEEAMAELRNLAELPFKALDPQAIAENKNPGRP
jgi:methyl-accepting chemotaxis protein